MQTERRHKRTRSHNTCSMPTLSAPRDITRAAYVLSMYARCVEELDNAVTVTFGKCSTTYRHKEPQPQPRSNTVLAPLAVSPAKAQKRRNVFTSAAARVFAPVQSHILYFFRGPRDK